ncbi:AraC family transcriptional regulator [Planctomycetota bacterium]|nr:AraC family transcriptional regulator [Planctomycetota bacterium]
MVAGRYRATHADAMRASHELIVPDGASVLRVVANQRPYFPFAWHQHPEIELTLIERGRGLRYVGDSIETYGPGDLVLLGSQLPHTWQSDPGGGSVAAVVIQFRPGDLVLPVPETAGLATLFTRAGRGLAVCDPALAEAVRGIAAESSTLARLGRFLRLLAALQSETATRPLALAASEAIDHRDERLAKVLALCHGQARRRLSVAEAARCAGLSSTGFSRWFRQRTGRTFVGHLAAVRISLMSRELIETDRPIAGIALRCGFSSLTNCNRTFARLMGCTPGEYRNRRTPS